MLGSSHWKPNDGDAFVLDLHGPTFDRVLIFLRTGKLWIGDLSPCDQEQLQTSLEYLQLTNAPLAWTWDATVCSYPSSLSNNKMTVTSKPDDEYIVIVMGSYPGTSFRVRVEGFDYDTRVGLCPRTPAFNVDKRWKNKGYFFSWMMA
ncbi:Aste57867_25454 [Aphanomyces stellatus]|uniref:Aste57867_25454 protein n=1 Tax=Aphanomyces stellatus TaxID=120398 RepID=A0A485LTB9_9STRA|nr:hypothetical protein As57867_025375 [Aphanomyces stellatus]VFU02077.1 Aste57867_25454 [Aphanomyces stellatus]